MIASSPDIWCCRGIELAARELPAEHRHRYTLEFIAELHGMRPPQRRHAAHVLSRALALRAALAEPAPGTRGERTMRDTTARPLLCRLNVHHRYRWASTEDGGRYLRCTKCGKDRTPGDHRNTIGA
jgi:hypothetical protein